MMRPADGAPKPFRVAADGIALSPDGRTLYFSVLSGRHLRAVPTEMLRDPSVDEGKLAKAVVDLGLKGASDGLAADAEGRVYGGDYEHDAIRRLANGRWQTIARDPRILWPDTLSIGADGYLYFTANQLERQPAFHEGRDLRQALRALSHQDRREAGDARPLISSHDQKECLHERRDGHDRQDHHRACDDRRAREGSLRELERLVKTLGYDVIGRVVQKREGTGAATLLGSGKLEELAALTGGTGVVGSMAPPPKAKARQCFDGAAETAVATEPDPEDTSLSTTSSRPARSAIWSGPPEPRSWIVRASSSRSTFTDVSTEAVSPSGSRRRRRTASGGMRSMPSRRAGWNVNEHMRSLYDMPHSRFDQLFRRTVELMSVRDLADWFGSEGEPRLRLPPDPAIARLAKRADPQLLGQPPAWLSRRDHDGAPYHPVGRGTGSRGPQRRQRDQARVTGRLPAVRRPTTALTASA